MAYRGASRIFCIGTFLLLGILCSPIQAQEESLEGTGVLATDAFDAYRLNGSQAVGTPVEAGVDGIAVPRMRIEVREKPPAVHHVAYGATNAHPLSKGDILQIRVGGRSVSGEGASGVAQLFVQSSRDWSKPLTQMVFPLSGVWQIRNRLFVVEEDYPVGTVFFNLFLGQQVQTLELGGIEIRNLGSRTPLADLESRIRPDSLAYDFESAFTPLPSSSGRSRIEGALPAGWHDDSGWADVDITYERALDDAFAGRGALRMEVGAVRAGAAQTRLSPVPLTPPWFVHIRMAVRSPTSASFRMGIRKAGPPYNFHGERNVAAGPEWSTVELLVPPSVVDPTAHFMFVFSSPGVVEVDDVRIDYRSLEEVDAGVPTEGNLLPNSSFPDGLQAPWSVSNDAYDPGNYVSDAAHPGPTKTAALKVTPGRMGQLGVAILSVPFRARGETEHTFSIWAKAAAPGHGLNLRMGPPSRQLWHAPYQKVITLTTEWTRYEHTVRLPYTPDGFYLAQVANWGPQGTFWIDGVQVERGDKAGPFQRTGIVEIVAQPEAPYGLFAEGEPFRVRFSATGDLKAGMILKSELHDVYGGVHPLPDQPIRRTRLHQASVRLPSVGEPPLGTYRLEYHLVDRNGNSASKIAETLLHRVRLPRHGMTRRPDSPFGVHITPNAEMPRVARMLGFTWARQFGMDWGSVEPEAGAWRFDEMDGVVDHLHEANLMVLGILGGVPEHARSWQMPVPRPEGYSSWHAKNVPPRDLKAWGDYAERMAARYRGKVDHWETWNEPFLPGFLNAGYENGAYVHPTPESFLPLHQAAAAGVRRGNPDASVILNAGAHYPAPANAWSTRLFDLGALDVADAVSYHAYIAGGLGTPGDAIHRATAAYRHPSNPALPIWNSEGGPGPSVIHNFYNHTPPFGHTTTTARAGDHLVRYYISTLASGAKKFFVYSYHAWGQWKPCYSYLNVDGRLAPTATAFSNLAWHLEGRRYREAVDLGGGVYAYLFEDDDGAVAVILSSGIGRLGMPQADASLAVRDLFGNAVAFPLRLGDLPVFVDAPGQNATGLMGALQKRVVSH